jgi:hypothetical protein
MSGWMQTVAAHKLFMNPLWRIDMLLNPKRNKPHFDQAKEYYEFMGKLTQK